MNYVKEEENLRYSTCPEKMGILLKDKRNKRKRLSEILLQYYWEADQKRQEQQNHESWLLQGHGTGEGFQTRT